MNIFSKITFRNLRKNRTRTLITIVGIILSTAMFSAVTTAVSSFQRFLYEYELEQNGNWYGAGYGVSFENVEKIREEDEIENLVFLEEKGFSYLEDSQNEYKPYLCVQAMSEGFADRMPVNLTEGRLPENPSEIILPDHLKENGGISYELSEKLTLSLGGRFLEDGWQLSNREAFLPEDESDMGESLENLHEETYTVVGFYERPSFEEYEAPGYTALTVFDAADKEEGNLYDVYFTLNDPKKTADFLDRHDMMFTSYTRNYALLRTMAASGETNFNQVLYGLASVLIAVIMVGSVSLIYNAFSISVSERTKQFGILSSVGATGRQLMKSVFTEGLFLGAVGIPLGILAGILGMWITFLAVGGKMANLLYGDYTTAFRLYPSVSALLIAAVLSLVTILVSAFLPAKRASKKSAIDAIRQSSDIRIRAKKLKVSPVTRKLFGFEGTIATKNYKRSRKKYRATVFSIFISVVLFISASSFGAYLIKTSSYIYEDLNYDVSVYVATKANQKTEEGESGKEDDDKTDAEETNKTEEIESYLGSINGVKRISYSNNDLSYVLIGVNRESLSKDYLENLRMNDIDYYEVSPMPDELLIYANFIFIDDEEFTRYLESLNLDRDDYFDPMNPKAIVMESVYGYNADAERMEVYRIFDDVEKAGIVFHPQRIIDGYSDYSEFSINEEGGYEFSYVTPDYYTLEDEMYEQQGDDYDHDAFEERAREEKKLVYLSIDEATARIPIACDVCTEKKPEMTPKVNDYQVILYFPYSQMEPLLRFYTETEDEFYNLPPQPLDENLSREYAIACDGHAKVAADIQTWINDRDIVAFVSDYAENMEEEKTMLWVVQVFSYGFIILISMIAAANVFNTISTNVNLRRREFAVLKSVGLAPKGFRKMMIFECLLYGMKGLLFGLPVSVGVTWLIYHQISDGMDMEFFVPWSSFAIAIGSVFLIVIMSMIYAVNKIKNKNTVEELKNENF